MKLLLKHLWQPIGWRKKKK